MDAMHYYSILGLNKNASKKEIRAQYIKLAMKKHPDRGNNNCKDFIELKSAYEKLIKLKDDSFCDNRYGIFTKAEVKNGIKCRCGGIYVIENLIGDIISCDYCSNSIEISD
ncbi:Chaperone protein DnaJ [Astathelohania contejeani]|uniref:Chaperone protein DnaJ n=1 Tax=Astathelohania contejeani TaxID=164912 RepID=A0ABQ7HYN9_9MICR|nr:Chaperone protein DnaJ [Thelohania contejeani]